MAQAGFQIGSYSVLSRLGAGGMGEVWLAMRAGKQCVVKTLLPHLADDEAVREMFLKEGRVASMISDSNVVRIYELGNAGGQYFMALEYVDGSSLDRLLQVKKKHTPIVAAYIASRAAAGLQAIHEQRHPDTGELLKIVHRDVSPSNLLLSIDGEVKIADFGIAKTFMTDPGGQTTHGTAKGKIGYMSPEQARGQKVDQRTDLFALGLVLYELLAGDIPYQRTKNDYEMLAQVVHGRGRALRQVVPDVPAPLLEMVERALALDPEKRWQNARSMRAALEQWLDAQPGAAAAAAELGAMVTQLRQARAPHPVTSRETQDVAVASPPQGTVNVRTPQAAPAPDVTPKVTPVIPDEAVPGPKKKKPSLVPVLAAVLGALAVISVAFGVSSGAEDALPPVPVVPVPTAEVQRAAEPEPEPTADEPEPAADEPEPAADEPVTTLSPTRPKRAKARKVAAPAPVAAPIEKTIAFEAVPPVDVYAGSTLLGRTPLEVPARPSALRLVSAADGIDYMVNVAGEQPERVVVPKGTLHVRVDPWAEVTLDGRALGVTPVAPVSVYAGRHVVDLVNDDLKQRRRVEVEVMAGEAKVLREKL
ncbi:MAG: protein kinase [Myxococcaceae bacterium]|nr:protein kinase [Myxococcaceae bacterium]